MARINTVYSDARESGIPMIGDLSWGTDFCQFYHSEQDLLEILAPYLAAGLKNNELCIWVTQSPSTAEEAARLFQGAIPRFGEYAARGQIRIISEKRWREQDRRSRGALVAALDAAISAGFDGLRLARHFHERKKGARLPAFNHSYFTGRYNVIALFSYPRDQFDAASLMRTVRHHRFALVRSAERWELIESSEVRTIRDALHRSEEKLRSLFANMSEGFAYHRIILDARRRPCDYIFHEVNDAFERLTGLRAKNILGKRVTQVVPDIAKDPVDWIGKYGRVALTGKPLQFEGYSATLGKWFLISAFSPHKGFFAVTFSDITDRKQTEQALRESEQRWATTLSSIGDAVIATDTEANVTFLNYAAESLTGWSLEEAVGKPVDTIFRVIHESDRKAVQDPARMALETGKIALLDPRTLLLRRNGAEIPIDDSGAPIRDKEGRLMGAVLIFRDISERRRHEKQLRQSIAKFELLSKTAARLLAADDPHDVVQDLCRDVMEFLDCQTFFNFLFDEPSGRLRLNTFAGIPTQEARKIKWLDVGVAVCGCVARDRKRIVAEHIANTPDVRTELIRSYGIQAYCCHPLLIQDRLIGTLSFGTRTRPSFTSEEVELMRTVANNVALAMQRIQIQKTLQDTNRGLEQKVLERTEQLASNYERLSHANAQLQIRASQLRRLASELTMAEQRERKRLSKVLHDGLQQHLATAKMLTGYFADKLRDQNRKRDAYAIEAILEESMQMSRSLSVELSPPVLQEAGLARGLEWLARRMKEKHGFSVQLEIDGQPDLPEDVTVLLFESVRELLFNAVKHSKVSRARVRLAVEKDHGARIEIRDNGVGFDPSRLDAIESVGGGLGLFSIRERIDSIGGRFDINSAPGRGSHFTLIAPGAMQVAPAVRGKARVSTNGSRVAKRGSPKIRVLLADDHALFRDGIGGILNQEPDIEVIGYAKDGMEAIDLVRKLGPSMVVMDIGMPGMDGIEATRAIHRRFPKVRIIGLSMYDDQERAEAMFSAGAVAYKSKACAPTELISTIRACSA